MKNKISKVSFCIKAEGTFTVEVTATWAGNDWRWDIYVDVLEDYPKFNDEDFLRDAMPSGRCESITLVTKIYSENNQVKFKTLFSTYWFDWDSGLHQSPLVGIPSYVKKDADKVVEILTKELTN